MAQTLQNYEQEYSKNIPVFLYSCFRIAMLTKRVRPEQADFYFYINFPLLYSNYLLPFATNRLPDFYLQRYLCVYICHIIHLKHKLMKYKILLLAFTILSAVAFSQSTGSLSGYVIDQGNLDPIPGAQVYVETKNGLIGTVTDSIGHFIIKPLNAGNYTLFASYMGYEKKSIVNIDVRGEFDTEIGKIDLNQGISMKTVVITYTRPLIDPEGGNVVFMDPKIISDLPDGRNLTTVLEIISSEFYVSDNQEEVHFRGSRNDMTAYLIDGIRVESMEGVPGLAIGSVSVYAGGIPARYGDFTGGVVVVETLGYYDWLNMQKAKDRLYNESNQ